MENKINDNNKFDRSEIITDIGAETNNRPRVNPEVKDAILSELNGNNPDVIVILNGGIRKNNKGEWGSVAWNSPDEHGLHTGSKIRVIAATEVANIFPNLPIVTTDRDQRKNDGEVTPTMASVLKKELIKRGIGPDRIILEEESAGTINQYIELLKMAKEYDWKSFAILINEYYEPRATALFENLKELVKDDDVSVMYDDFINNGGKFTFINGEPILRVVNDHYIKYLNDVENSPQYQDTVMREARGLQAIQDKTYKYTYIKPDSRNK